MLKDQFDMTLEYSQKDSSHLLKYSINCSSVTYLRLDGHVNRYAIKSSWREAICTHQIFMSALRHLLTGAHALFNSSNGSNSKVNMHGLVIWCLYNPTRESQTRVVKEATTLCPNRRAYMLRCCKQTWSNHLTQYVQWLTCKNSKSTWNSKWPISAWGESTKEFLCMTPLADKAFSQSPGAKGKIRAFASRKICLKTNQVKCCFSCIFCTETEPPPRDVCPF